jgi:hypothetical protein
MTGGVLATFALAFASRWRSSGARLRLDSYCRRSKTSTLGGTDLVAEDCWN